ncbi:FAD-dependent thymidylate synthase [Desulfobotulus sp. H1]|uniref:FAD-dependent thymidylate synthase n=1 Tax=Desulfobotulus pelophilus TaxID=2823377 RepID=A0ABT3N5S3_9BACT|nr:FAD-dependent thymidylate synthase [Desulfobotulus pelophilus]MCW7752812.1 FAD-dependent thymidylate synthase [Desulfobotulus pelophilus]
MKKARALIINHTPEPERICAASARISTKEGSATTIYEETRRENIGGLIRNVMGLGHQSIAEHAVFTLAFEDVSVFFEQYLIEFRLAAYTVKSRRYVDYAGMGWLRPDFRFEKPEADRSRFEAVYDEQMQRLFDAYAHLTSLGIPKEDARFLLPCSFRSHIYCTMNARELLHFLTTSLLGRGRVYPEIRSLGELILNQARAVLPDVFDGLTAPETVLLSARVEKGPERDFFRKTRLISGPEDGEKMVALAALMRQGVGPDGAENLLRKDPSLKQAMVRRVLADARPRELEQVNYTFHIPGISLASLTHMTRHRIQNLVVPDFAHYGRHGMVLPETINRMPEALMIYQEAVAGSDALWRKGQDAGLVPEDSVYLLVAGNTTDIYSTMNARQLFHFLRLRTCFRAQWEIREIAWEMRALLMERDPGLFHLAGPGCGHGGRCPEGRMSCGRMAEVRERMGQ